MPLRRKSAGAAAALFVVGFAFTSARAYIERMYSLAEVLDESTHIVVGRISAIDAARKTAVATIERAIKGGKEYETVQMNIGLGPSVQAKYLLELLRDEDPFLLFYKREGSEIVSLAHVGDTWLQLFATHERNTERVWWRFTHLEIYMGRTYDGTTPELIRLTEDVLAGRRKPPAPNASVPKLELTSPRRRARRETPAELLRPVERGGEWRYWKGRRAPAGGETAWRSAGFDDSSWELGRAPFGYGDGPFGTELDDTRGGNGKSPYTTVYLRRSFELPDRAKVTKIELAADYDDGFALWINGKEALSKNAPADGAAHDRLASGNHESGTYETFSVSDPSSFFVPGANVFAVQVFNVGADSSDLKLDLEAVLEVARTPGGFVRILDLALPEGEPRGVSWIDVNGDDLLDVSISRGAGDVILVNEGESFANRTREIGLEAASRTMTWADFDLDDHPDLLAGNPTKIELFANASGRIEKRSGGLALPKQRNFEGAGWIDYDGDGLPDIFATNGEHGALLYRNTGKGFEDVSARAGFGKDLGRGNGDFVAFADYDGDGYVDILYNLDSGVLLHNEGNGTFTRDERSGIELPGGSAYKRGVSFADYDGDGDLDLFVPGPEKGRLFRNENDGTFRDVIDGAKDLARASASSFSAAWGDIDNDGHLDLFVCRTNGPSGLFRGDGKGGFTDVTGDVGLGKLPPAFAASFADSDGDGDLDLAINFERGIGIFRNEVAKQKDSAGLIVRVGRRKGRIGSVVRVSDAGDRPLGLRELNGAEGPGGQAAPDAHFGVPRGKVHVTVVSSDGRFGRKDVEIDSAVSIVTLRDEDFSE